MEEADVKARLGRALQLLSRHDAYLIYSHGERTIVHRLAVHMCAEFPELNVDVEYNRNGQYPKRLGKVIATPDIIVHRRGTNDENLLVLEMKRATDRRGQDDDRRRVRAFMRKPYYYAFGALLLVKGTEIEVEWVPPIYPVHADSDDAD